jgi:O-acetyl-ADP-ribose deacetylase (regulator of RNase III)
MARRMVGRTCIEVVEGDITAVVVDAIVNAANEQLVHGGGVAAAISKAGGPSIQDESSRWVAAHGQVVPGTVAVTTAGALPARWVVHTVGPRYRAGADNARLLSDAVVAALDAVAEMEGRSLAFPAISAGIFGYPRRDATEVIAAAVVAWVSGHPDALDEVVLVGHDSGTCGDFAAGVASAIDV